MTASNIDTQILVVAKPVTVATEASMQIDFAAGFAVDTTNTNITVSTTGIPATYQSESLVAWPGIGTTASAVSGQLVTVASTELTVGTLYGFFITAGIDNPGSTGQYSSTIRTRTSGPATIDQTIVASRIITSDQVTITATVPPTFTFTLSANSDTFTGNLDPAAVVSTNGVTVSISTNAANGWTAWVRSANAALSSTTTGQSIATSGTVDGSPTTLSTGADGYVLDADLTTDSGTGTGTVSIAGEYNGATTSAGGTLSTTLQQFATCTGTTAGDVITLIARASITAVKPAASDYTDTWTVIGAGVF